MKITKYEKYMYIFILLLASTIILNYGFTFAKYVASNAWNYYLKSKDFYFASDYLNVNGVDNINSKWDGGSVYFNLKNNVNQQHITTDDIDYDVTCEVIGSPAAYTTCELNNSNGDTVSGTINASKSCSNHTSDQVVVSGYNEVDCQNGGYDWQDQIVVNNLFFDLTTQNAEALDDVEVLITAVSTNPYHQTLTGLFKLHKKPVLSNAVYGAYQSYINYDRLVITNPSDDQTCISVSWDASKLLINASANEFSSVSQDFSNNIEQVKLNIAANNSVSYQFYKIDNNQTYDLSEFTITNTTGC